MTSQFLSKRKFDFKVEISEILCDKNSGIENICSWKREPIKKIKKSDLLEVDKDIVNKYLVKVNSTSSFVLNTFRSYKFK